MVSIISNWQERAIFQCYKPIIKEKIFGGKAFSMQHWLNNFIFVPFSTASFPTKANFEWQESTFPSLPCSSLCDCAINGKGWNGKKETHQNPTAQWMMNAIQKYMSLHGLELQKRRERSLKKYKHPKYRQSLVNKVFFLKVFILTTCIRPLLYC